jgi:hypothetical protein
MSEDDVEAGLAGKPYQPGMSLEDYERGVRMRVGPKVEVPGVAYALIIASPLLPLVYPVLGIVVNGTFAGVTLLASRVSGVGNWGFLIGFLAGIASFFPGLRLEARATQVTLYRIARASWRILAPVGVASLARFDESGFLLEPNASGGAVGGGIAIGLIVFFVCGLLDRLYFPVKAQVLKEREQLDKGIRPTRPLIKRLVYGALWLIPIFVLSNVVVMIGVRMFTADRAVYDAFYASYSPIIYVVGGVLWCVLCSLGILPGTGKHAKTMVDPNLVEV